MRYLVLFALAIVLANPAATAVQTPSSELWVTIRPSGIPGGSAAVRVQNAEMYVDGASAGVGVPGQESAPAVMFSIRAWKEQQKARVVVYAVLADKRAPGGNTETPIATFAIAPGESMEVPQAEKWGGNRLAVTAALR